MSTTCPKQQRGLGVIAAIVILVILAGLAGFVVSISTTQNIGLAQDVQGARALRAAAAGIEWGTARWLAASTCDSGTLSGLDGGFTVVVAGTSSSAGGHFFCELVATATGGGSPGGLGYVERQMRAVVEGP